MTTDPQDVALLLDRLRVATRDMDKETAQVAYSLLMATDDVDWKASAIQAAIIGADLPIHQLKVMAGMPHLEVLS